MRRCSLLLLLVTFLPATTARAWKPSTHVYLALQALDEITGTSDLFGHPKAANTIVIYRVNYQTGKVLEKLGEYEADGALVEALDTHRREFIMGVLGPDAYPDIATGQMRTHVRHPVYTDRWLQYLWDQAQGKDEAITAFVMGYLNHAAGDMFMHTFINHYAGGPWANDFTRTDLNNPLNFNGARHVIVESYIGQRAPALPPSAYDLGQEPVPVLREFLYKHLADARAGSFFGDAVMPVKPLLGSVNGDIDFEASVPRAFGNLRNGLSNYLFVVDTTTAGFDTRIQAFFADAAERSCPTGVTCSSPITEQTPACTAACAAAAAQAAPFEAQKTAYLAANSGPYTFTRAWIADIDEGLRAWIDLNHQIAQKLIFHADGASDLQGARELATTYRNEHLLSMLGAPDVVGQYLGFTQAMKEMYLKDFEDVMRLLEDNLVHIFFRVLYDMTPEEFQEMYLSPQAVFDDLIPLPYTSEDGDVAQPITLKTLNRTLLGIDDDAYDFPARTWDPMAFEPAYNTLLMTKLMLLSEAGARNLFADLGADCSDPDACRLDGPVMLGFMRSLDEDNQWLPDRENLDDPLFGHLKHPLQPFAFEECLLYGQLFKRQIGEYEGAGYTGPDGRTADARPCAPIAPLAAPIVTPAGGTFDAPQEVTITHPDDDVELYYTLAVPGVEVEPIQPTASFNDSRVHLYEAPFSIYPPLDPSQLPLTLRVKAYKPGYLPSETVVHAFDVDARLATPVLSHASGEYLEPFRVSVTLPNDPGGSGIYYTLTGKDPDYNDTAYRGPLQLPRGEHTLKVVAYRPGYVRSQIAEASYRVFAPSEVTRAEPPFFTSPRGSGRYTTRVDLAMDTHTQGGTIRWTIGQDQLPAIDPSETLGSTYTEPITLGKGNWFIRAITIKDGLFPSEIAQINVNVVDPLGTTAPPTVRPAGGVFHNDVEVQLVSAVTFVDNQGQTVVDSSGLQLQYTLDGSDPDINPSYNPLANRRYLRPFTLRRSATLRALAYRTFFPISEITEVTFDLVCATPTIAPGAGRYYDAVQVNLTSITENATIRYTLDGSEPTETSTRYDGPFSLTESATVRARAYKNGYTFSDIATANLLVTPSAPPVITRQPTHVEAVIGSTALLAVQAAGTPEPTYQWFFGETPIDGATDDTLRIANVTSARAGSYRVSLTNPAGAVTSQPITLAVVPEPVAPAITQDLPDTLVVKAQDPTLFGITATGTPTPTYRWYRNGQLLPSQTGATISYARADLPHAGTYMVVARNSAGADSSRVMQLVIRLATNVSAVGDDEVPTTFELGQNYPNPFNPRTTIPFAVPEPSHVRLTLYDLAGRQLAVLLDRHFAPGRYTATFDGSRLASGLYFYRLETRDWAEVKKLMLVK